MDSFSCSPLNTLFNIGKGEKGIQKILIMLRCDMHVTQHHFNIKIMSRIDMPSACSCLFLIFPTSWYRVCKIELSDLGKNSGNLDLVWGWGRRPHIASPLSVHPVPYVCPVVYEDYFSHTLELGGVICVTLTHL